MMKEKGLTLMELLIVVGIVLSLWGLILGVTKMAKEASMKVQCMNNLRQLYLASKMYEQTFGEPPISYGNLLAWQPSLKLLLICPKDPFKGYAAGGWSYVTSPVHSDPDYVPHSYSPQYWGAYWILKGRIKIFGPPEMIERIRKKVIEELQSGDYFICAYHWMAISVDGKIRPWGPPWRVKEER